MSRVQRLVLSDRYFFVTCNLSRTRRNLAEDEFRVLADVFDSRRQGVGFLLTAWVFLPDHWHAILFPQHLLTISRLMEEIKVSSTRRINAHQGESDRLWQLRFFDRALRTVKEYHKCVEYIHWNPVKRGLATKPEEWNWSSVHAFACGSRMIEGRPGSVNQVLQIDQTDLPAELSTRI